MAAECKTIRYLRGLAERKGGRDNAAPAAAAALAIIADVRENYLGRHDVSILHMLLDEIRKSGHDALTEYLREGAADCELCAGLVASAGRF